MEQQWKQYDPEQLVKLVANIGQEYSNGMSSSLPYEIANNIMGSILYNLQQSENAINDANNSTELSLHSEALEDAYKRGKDIVIKKTKQAKEKYKEMLTTFNGYGIFALESEMEKSFKNFFNQYDPIYNSSDDPVTFLYPVMGNPESLHGIDAALTRLNCIQAEEEFLKDIDPYLIETILQDFTGGLPGSPAYEEVFVSIAYEVLRRFVLCYVAWVPTETTRDNLIKVLNSKIQDIDPTREVPDAIMAIAHRACPDNQFVEQYLMLGANNIIQNLDYGIQKNDLRGIV